MDLRLAARPQLASMSASGSSIAYGYNADGKRISKTVNGTTYNYAYLGRPADGDDMGQQQAALYLRLHWPGVCDVQRQQVFLPEKMPKAMSPVLSMPAAPRWCPTPTIPGVRPCPPTAPWLPPSAPRTPCATAGMSTTPRRACTTSTSRYYNPVWGRFINADTAGVVATSPDKTHWDKNLFAYCMIIQLIGEMMAAIYGSMSSVK